MNLNLSTSVASTTAVRRAPGPRPWSRRAAALASVAMLAVLIEVMAYCTGSAAAQELDSGRFQPLLADEEVSSVPAAGLGEEIRFSRPYPNREYNQAPLLGSYPREEAFSRPEDCIGTAPCETVGGRFYGDPVAREWAGLAPHEKLGRILTSPMHRARFARIQMPLIGESWQYRPFSAGWFMGGMGGSPLISDWMGTGHGFLGGYQFGWDFDHYWGTEVRFSFASLSMWDSLLAQRAQRQADDDAGLAPDDPWRRRYDCRRDATVSMFDLNLLYYPWGDDAWRPYFRLGLGTVRVQCQDRLATDYDSTVVGIPFGIGVKYRVFNWLVLRGELADNVAIHAGSSFNTQHNLSFTFGMEVRFGGSRTAYWPWNPGIHYW